MRAFKGQLQKLTWPQVRDSAIKSNPELAKIIDSLSPDNKHWLVKATYPYGSYILKRALLWLPNLVGQIVPITDSSIPAEIRQGLSYNIQSNPVSLVLKNCFEIFLPLEDRTLPLTGLISRGAAFGAWRILNLRETQHPIFIWDMTAGARSVFMLPKITEAKKHMALKKAFNLTANAPNSLMDHWEIFRQLANSAQFKEPWDAEILFFPEQWFKHLDDDKWKPFYYYFRNSAWRGSEHWRNQYIWNLIFSLILKNYEARSSAYVMDTAKHLLYIGVGSFSGFAPCRDDTAGPFREIQTIYQNDYELRPYPPIIMQPELFDMYDTKGHSVYYSLQFPNALEFKPNSRLRTSAIADLHEIRSLMIRYEQELTSEKFNISGTSFNHLFQQAQYDYFHNGVDLHIGMRNSAEMPQEDKSLLTTLDGIEHTEFPDTCSFVRGCIRISHKKSVG